MYPPPCGISGSPLMVVESPLMSDEKPRARRGESVPEDGPSTGKTLATAGKILLGLGLIIVIIVLLGGLRGRDGVSGHMGSGVTEAMIQSTGENSAAGEPLSTTSTSLTQLEQAEAENGYLAARASAGLGAEDIRVYDSIPPGSKLTHTFPRTGELDVVTTFLVKDEAVSDDGRRWYEVYLPVRPNGSTGWVRAEDVDTVRLDHHVRVRLEDYELDLFQNGKLVDTYPVGLGKEGTPTPGGTYYVTIKMRPSNPAGAYGQLAMGISGFSEQLPDWPGGGQVGIHGTNDESSVGSSVSHGCIRLHNEDILELNPSVPLGTPVFIER